MALAFHPTADAQIVMIGNDGIARLMDLDEAASHARFLERILIQDGRKAADYERDGEPMMARVYRAGVTASADNLAALTEAMEAARDHQPVEWNPPLSLDGPLTLFGKVVGQ